MNDKGVQTTTVLVVFGLIIGVIFSIILLDLSGKFISTGTSEKNLNSFYFAKLAEDLLKMNDGDKINSIFLTSKNKALLAFNKEIEAVKIDELNACIDYELSQDIKKPVKCRDKNCLCNCNSDLSLIENELTIDCEATEIVCIPAPININPANSCKTFILYDKEEKQYNLETKKEKEAFFIEITSKTL